MRFPRCPGLSAASSPQTSRPVFWTPVSLAHSSFSGSHCRWPLPVLSLPSQYSGPQSCWIFPYSRLLFAASVISPGAAATFASQKPKKVQKTIENIAPSASGLGEKGSGGAVDSAIKHSPVQNSGSERAPSPLRSGREFDLELARRRANGVRLPRDSAAADGNWAGSSLPLFFFHAA